MDRFWHLWAYHRALVVAFIGVIAVSLFFAMQTITATTYWMDPAHHDQPLAPWMTPRYVAKSYGLPPEVLGPALFLEQGAPPKRISIGTIAVDTGMTMQQLQQRIDAAAAAWRAARS
ncbi:hypothetical protein [Yoonia sp. MH D7]